MSQANSTQEQQKNQTEVAEVLTMAQALVNSQTTKPTFKEKLKSRKFWIAVAGVASGVCGIINAGDNTTAMVTFVILQIVSVVAYCIAEGSIDATRTKQLAEAAATLIEMIGGTINASDYINGGAHIATCSSEIESGHYGPVQEPTPAYKEESVPAEFRA